jgi:hypothetical protein
MPVCVCVCAFVHQVLLEFDSLLSNSCTLFMLLHSLLSFFYMYMYITGNAENLTPLSQILITPEAQPALHSYHQQQQPFRYAPSSFSSPPTLPFLLPSFTLSHLSFIGETGEEE